ncbi:MAG: flagellar biosynthesis anti-sigma factor FlgM [Pseudomonadota bacterium]|nr:flagellar biosynthesis anti-sigma factor FlgM [Pseudomonadota bacterium]
MANDINTSNAASVLGTIARGLNAPAAGTERKTSDSETPAVSSSDRVSVTSEAARLQEIEEQLMAVPEVNSQKVAEIKAMIANGTFDFNPQRIAEKLIAFESGGK